MSVKLLHKKWRNEFNITVLNRDKNICKVCGNGGKLDVHHITNRHDLSNGGYVESNGISLCELCHRMAEDYHISNGKFYGVGWHPNDLYTMINSSYEKASEDSKNLK
jgi:hypothetical protein